MSLWELVKAHLEREATLGTDRAGEPVDLELQAATAVLLLEAAHGDQEYAWSEHRAILQGLERGFGIGKKKALELMGRAEEIRPPVVKLDDVIGVIADRFTEAQREEIVTLLWKVIDADDVVQEWEKAFAKHVARAVGLSGAKAHAARRRARE